MDRLAYCRKKKIVLVLALAHSLVSYPVLSSANEPPDAESTEVFPLPEIVVTAKKIKAPPTLIARVVGLEDIDAWNAPTAGDALTWVPGVNVQVGGSSADSRAWIRGFRDRDVLVLYDGIPVASGFEGTIDLNEISLQSVSTIKVMKSAPSVIYGTNGMGGVVDVIPATGLTGRSFGGRAELGSDERRLFRAYANGGSENFGYSVSASHQQADDFSLSDDYTPELNQPDDKRVNSDFKRNSLFMRLEGNSEFVGDTAFFVNYANAEKGLPVETGVEDPDYERLTDSERLTLGLSNHFRSIPLSVKLYYNSYDSELSIFTDSSFTEIDEVEVAEDYSWGGKLYSVIETSERNTIILTGGGQKDVFKGEGELEEGNRAEITTWTLAAENEFWMTDKVSLAAGLIYTYFDQTLLNKSTSALNPQIAVAWQATDQLSLHASAAQRTRFPKLRELYRDRYGNPDLHEQEAKNYEIGFRYQHGGAWSSDFAVFRSDIDGLIERPNRRSTYQNLDRVTLKGVELSSGGWINDKVFLRAGYTYVDAEETIEDGSNRQLRSRPKHTGLVEFRYQFPGQWLLTTNGIYVSGLYDLDPEGVYTEVDNYFVGNLKLNKTFTARFDGYISVSNLFDTDYVHRIGYPREGRAFVVGVAAAF
jgi:iron complex outermembrane receptor protein